MMAILKTRLLVFAFTALALIPVPVLAFDSQQKSNMHAAVADFVRAIDTGNYGTMFDFMPPRILDYIVDQSGIDRTALLSEMKQQADAIMAQAKSVTYTLDAHSATFAMTPDGSREYALIPTELIVDIEGAGRTRVKSDTLAFLDEGKWYLTRIEKSETIQILVKMYPEFDGVIFHPSTIEAEK